MTKVSLPRSEERGDGASRIARGTMLTIRPKNYSLLIPLLYHSPLYPSSEKLRFFTQPFFALGIEQCFIFFCAERKRCEQCHLIGNTFRIVLHEYFSDAVCHQQSLHKQIYFILMSTIPNILYPLGICQAFFYPLDIKLGL